VTRGILLLGGSGQVGTALTRRLGLVTAPTRSAFDLATASSESTRRMIGEIRPEAIVNCAGYTAVDRAEEEEGLADAINGSAVGTLAMVAAELAIPFVTFSTDYVFDGRAGTPYLESSPPDPINSYGRSKLIGERLALAVNPRTLVVRTSWVVSGTHPNFVATMLRLTREGHSVNVVDDQHGCPTIADDLAAATVRAMSLGANGVVHLTNRGATTWFGLARAAVVEAGLDAGLVVPCTTEDYPTAARRPAYSVLGSERIAEIGIDPLPPWQESLGPVVARLMAD
jgi:dTDP-4-dehydrorhamnose reductase